MQNNNNNNDITPMLPLKPKVIAKRTTHVPIHHGGFVSAAELYANSVRRPINRSDAVLMPDPVGDLVKRNKVNLLEVEEEHAPKKVPPKRKFEEFISEADLEGQSDAVAVENYWRHRYGRKIAKIANLRNRLRAVGLSNIQVVEELTAAQIQLAALKGANASLHAHNVELQDKIKQMLVAKEYCFREMIRVGITPDEDEELTPTLEELYSDEILELEERTPAPTRTETPNAPPRFKPKVPSSNTDTSHVPSPNGVPVVPLPTQPLNEHTDH